MLRVLCLCGSCLGGGGRWGREVSEFGAFSPFGFQPGEGSEFRVRDSIKSSVFVYSLQHSMVYSMCM